MLPHCHPDCREVMAHLVACGVAMIAGPIRRTGARDRHRALVYCRDPDLNLIEVDPLTGR